MTVKSVSCDERRAVFEMSSRAVKAAEQEQSLEKSRAIFFPQNFPAATYFLQKQITIDLKTKMRSSLWFGASVLGRAIPQKNISDSAEGLWRKHGESHAVLFRPATSS